MSFGKGGDAAEQAAAANMAGIQEIRRQFDATKEDVDPFVQAGTEALPGVQEGSTLGGFGEMLRRIFQGGDLDPLVDERTRALRNNQSFAGTRRSGKGFQDIANIPTQLGFDLENLLFGRKQNLAGQGVNAALNLGQQGGNAASGIASLHQNTGQQRASGSLLDSQAFTEAINQGMGVASTVLPMIFGSDPALKKNVEEISEINGLKLYQWDWIPEAKGTFLETCPTKGFMADEVEEKYPQHVYEYGGYKMIAYFDLLNELEAKNITEERVN